MTEARETASGGGGAGRPRPPRTGWLSAPEAARQLGVSRATLYAYVSRKLIRSEAHAGGRERRYRAEDVALLLERREQRRNPGRVVEEALHWGSPLLESSLTLIRDGRFYYRGRDVRELALGARFEEVAAWLWTGDAAAPFPSALPARLPAELRGLRRAAAALPPIEAFQTLLPAMAARDPASYDLSPPAVQRTGARILRLFAAVAAGRPASRRPIAEVLQQAWSPRAPGARPLLEATLVLWSDHELNASTFTARCVASTLSNPYAVVGAALGALRGAKHGGASEQVEALFDEVREPARVRPVLEARLRRGEQLPGFGQPLYPDGDPRAALLLELLRAARPRARALVLAGELCAAASTLIERRPNVDFAVVTLARALRLPPGSAMALISIGRTAGWIAHAIEQYADPRLVRPRARYVGEPPREAGASDGARGGGGRPAGRDARDRPKARRPA